MKFDDWLSDYYKEILNMKKEVKSKFKMDVGEGKIYQLFLVGYCSFRSEKINRRLVFATWVLAITTIILSVVTIYLQYVS